MLEMLNPSAGDMLRFAAHAVATRRRLLGAWKQDRQEGQRLVAEAFSTPPASARRQPDLARLRDDTQRHFGWSRAQWAAHEPALQGVLADLQRSTLTVQGERVQTYHWPAAGRSQGRVLLCHGWEGYALNFALLVHQLQGAGYEVHAFDHLAHGASGGTVSGLPVVLQTLLEVAEHVEHEYGPLHALAGHSLGGAAASWAAAHGRIAVQRLVLLAPFYDTRTLSRLWAKAHLLNDELRDALQAELEATSGLTFDDFMPEGLAPHYTQRKLPALVIHDRKDMITAYRNSEQLSQLVPGLQLHDAKGQGHVAMLADDATMQRAVRFIQGESLRG
jgi:pimeloyl-ACP methyl ester carboxylesterase